MKELGPGEIKPPSTDSSAAAAAAAAAGTAVSSLVSAQKSDLVLLRNANVSYLPLTSLLAQSTKYTRLHF